MPTLLVEGDEWRRVAALVVADSSAARMRGLLGLDGTDSAMLLTPASSIHTFGMRFAIDAGFCRPDLTVVTTLRLVPQRVTRPRRGVTHVIEAAAGAFDRWGVRAGTRLAVDWSDGAP